MEKLNKFNAELEDRSMNPDVLDEQTPAEKMDLSESIPIEEIYSKYLEHGDVESPADFTRLDEDELTVLDTMLGDVVTEGQGGSGGTGGDKTGERTPGGMSEDLTAGRLKHGTFGGPTGSDYTFLGDSDDVATETSKIKADRTYSSPRTDRELSKKIAAENTRILNNFKT